MKPKILIIDDGVGSWQLLTMTVEPHGCYLVGAAYVQKPVKANELVARLQQVTASLATAR